MIGQWQELLSQLEVINSGSEICTQEEILFFESRNRIILPTGYKEYSQIFGTGLLGYGMHIYAPTSYLIEYSQETLESFRETLVMFPSESPQRDKRLDSLFQSSFIFGDDSGAHVALWDLRTFGDDENYDIYWVDIDLIDEEYQIGRDFFEFVSGFCLARASYDFLPVEKQPSLDQPQRFESFASPNSF
jgi:hypothetical protein